MFPKEIAARICRVEVDPVQTAWEIDQFTNAMVKKFNSRLQAAEMDAIEIERLLPSVAMIALRGDKFSLTQELLTFRETDLWWLEPALDEVSAELAHDLQAELHLKPRPLTLEIAEKIERALELLLLVWPEAHEQYKRLVSQVVLVDGADSGFRSATAIYAFGAVFLHEGSEWTAVDFMDYLLHESGHLSLAIKQTFCRLIENFNEKAASPFRSDTRWLNGILHASFVLWRICEGLNRLETINAQLTSSERATKERLLPKYLKDFEETLHTLRYRAIFTSVGKLLFDQLEESFERLTKKERI